MCKFEKKPVVQKNNQLWTSEMSIQNAGEWFKYPLLLMHDKDDKGNHGKTFSIKMK